MAAAFDAAGEEEQARVDASRSRQEGGGAGLGLAIASALVSAHHGEVELATAPGEGAVFRVLLPSAEER